MRRAHEHHGGHDEKMLVKRLGVFEQMHPDARVKPLGIILFFLELHGQSPRFPRGGRFFLAHIAPQFFFERGLNLVYAAIQAVLMDQCVVRALLHDACRHRARR